MEIIRGSPLGPREQQIAGLVAQGLTNQQIADDLKLNADTVRKEVINILRKLGLRNRSGLARRAYLDANRPLSLKEAGEMCGLTRDEVKELIDRGTLGRTRIGRTWYTSKKAIEDYLTSLSRENPDNTVSSMDCPES